MKCGEQTVAGAAGELVNPTLAWLQREGPIRPTVLTLLGYYIILVGLDHMIPEHRDSLVPKLTAMFERVGSGVGGGLQ